MENKPKSKALIITFIIVLILLLLGYYAWSKRGQLFGTKGSISTSRIFSPLLGTSKNKKLKVIDNNPSTDTNTNENTDNTQTTSSWITVTDESGNQVVRAQAGEDLKKGDVLYVSGINKNQDPIVMKAIASDPAKSTVFGVAGEDMKKGALGKVIIKGVLTGVPTNRKEGTLWAVNNILYLSDKIFGGLTKNAPVAPSIIAPVGSVLKVDPINGSIRIGVGQDGTPLFKPITLPMGSKSGIQNAGNGGIGYGFGNSNGNGIGSGNGGFGGTPGTGNVNGGGFGGTPGTGSGGVRDNGYNGDANGYNGDNSVSGEKNKKSTESTENSCQLIESNPLVFTDDEKARLTVLLRKFYLISSTLKTQDDITNISNEISQYQNFTNQIESLTKQCYDQIPDSMLATNGWVRHGNPWYTKSTSGAFPYTSENKGYLDYNQLDGAGKDKFKAISGYYYGNETEGGVSYDNCSKYNTFEGYGLSNQINNKKDTYTGHYCTKGSSAGKIIGAVTGVGVGAVIGLPSLVIGTGATIAGSLIDLFGGCTEWEAHGAGFPGDSLVDYGNRSGSKQIDQAMPNKKILERGCSWKDGVILDNTERLLNIW